LGKGELIRIKKEKRELNKLLCQLHDETIGHFDNQEHIRLFIAKIKEEKPRYIRDQLSLILYVCEHPTLNRCIQKALDYCVRNNIYSESEFRAAAEYFYEISKTPTRASPKSTLSKVYPLTKPKIRDIDEYKKAMEG
jgi:hypothetical protein